MNFRLLRYTLIACLLLASAASAADSQQNSSRASATVFSQMVSQWSGDDTTSLLPVDTPLNSSTKWIKKRKPSYIDMKLEAPVGDPVKAIADGEVIYSGWYGGYGRVVVARTKDGKSVCYSQVKNPCVERGSILTAGQVIGQVTRFPVPPLILSHGVSIGDWVTRMEKCRKKYGWKPIEVSSGIRIIITKAQKPNANEPPAVAN